MLYGRGTTLPGRVTMVFLERYNIIKITRAKEVLQNGQASDWPSSLNRRKKNLLTRIAFIIKINYHTLQLFNRRPFYFIESLYVFTIYYVM